MKVVLTTLNSKFIHSNLAIRYLKSYVEEIIPVELLEFTINQNINFIASEIYKAKPDVLGLSTYIWNLEETLQVAETIKIISPDTKILLGGPEVSFEGEDILEKHQFIDYIIYGEGEETFKEFILALLNKNTLEGILGLIYKEEKTIKNLPRDLIIDMNTIPSPYNIVSEEYKNKIVYYESSRGCPFNCEFCLSSTIKGVRYLPIERVKKDIENLIDSKVSQVKFVDRTFNANKKYAMEIMKFIMDKDPIGINFHFEVTAHLIDEEMLEFLKTCKEGLFQLEIGVQSTNTKTIDAIGRITNFDKLKKICITIKSFKNIHQHLDLIAGLPYEDYESFKKSFNDVYSIRPEKLQLGFLKLLKGSGLRIDEHKYGYKYLDRPPYEVLENNYLKYPKIIKLREIEDLVEKYYNEEYFSNSLELIITNFYNTPFDFYEDFSNYWVEKKLDKISHSRQNLYSILLEFFIYKEFNNKGLFEEMLKFDYIKNNRNLNYPIINNTMNMGISQTRLHEILKDERIIENYLITYKDLPTKKIIKNIIIEGFKYDILNIIENDYKEVISDKSIKYILFNFNDSKLIRCNTFDITNIVRG